MTVVGRRVRANPARSASEAWNVIVDLLAPLHDSPARQELLGISGIASSLIADEALKDVPCVVWGEGPRVRIYCLHSENAITGDDSNEATLAFTPTDGQWNMSLPCPEEDLTWVQAALKKRSTHVTARELTASVESNAAEDEDNQKSVTVNREAFLR